MPANPNIFQTSLMQLGQYFAAQKAAQDAAPAPFTMGSGGTMPQGTQLQIPTDQFNIPGMNPSSLSGTNPTPAAVSTPNYAQAIRGAQLNSQGPAQTGAAPSYDVAADPDPDWLYTGQQSAAGPTGAGGVADSAAGAGGMSVGAQNSLMSAMAGIGQSISNAGKTIAGVNTMPSIISGGPIPSINQVVPTLIGRRAS